MFYIKEIKWVIMDKDRTVIAKGVPRNRWLISVDDKRDKKRVLYYTSEAKAIAGFTGSGFYNSWKPGTRESYELEAVRVELTIQEI